MDKSHNFHRSDYHLFSQDFLIEQDSVPCISLYITINK
jgi:hypothetical protein